uniref:Uncharacterized protein n=1 Tax=Anguilla anguilla TaxID=7936 RepID=A0A0E9VFZ6_ANGAN
MFCSPNDSAAWLESAHIP